MGHVRGPPRTCRTVARLSVADSGPQTWTVGRPKDANRAPDSGCPFLKERGRSFLKERGRSSPEARVSCDVFLDSRTGARRRQRGVGVKARPEVDPLRGLGLDG